jgi:glycosyltransferase involved in cell wall biosynthesis
MVNILFIITANTYGGAEHSVYKIAKHIDRKRFRPAIACLGNDKFFIERVQKSGIRLFPLNAGRGLDVSVLLKLYAILKKERIDILHSELFRADFYGRLAAKLAGTRIIVSKIQNIEKFRESILLNWIDRLTARYANKIMCVSDSVREHAIQKIQLPRHRFVTIHNFVNIEEYRRTDDSERKRLEYRRALGIKDKNLLVGTVGRLAPQKAQADFLKAACMILKETPSVRFIVVGEGCLREELGALAEALGLAANIHFVGFQKNISVVLSAMDIFVLSSRWEGLPLTVCEAMASYLPVVATKVGGVPELVQNGKTGILVDAGNVNQLSESIQRLILDEKQRVRFGQEGRVRVEKEFSMSKALERMQTVYANCLKAKTVS